MKICFLASSDSIHSHKWIKYFVELGYEVTWISLVPCSIDIPNNVNYFELGSKNKVLGFFLAIIQSRKIISKFSPDVLHVHYVGAYALLGLFSDAKRIVATLWGSDVIVNKNSVLKRWVISKILRRSSLITCDAYHMRDEIMSFEIPAEKIHIINFGINLHLFSKKPVSQKIRQQLGFSDEPIILSLRGFDPVYDMENLIRAIPLVLSRARHARFVLLGKGALKDDMILLAKQLNVNQAIVFLDYIENEKLPTFLSSMDIYVSTSLSDAGIAASTAEAMACELPVVITDSGENNRWIVDGDNGFLTPVRDSKLLADRIVSLIKNPKMRASFGKNARRTILLRNDYDVEMSKMEGLYKKILLN